MSKITKICSVILSLAMLVSMITITGSAADNKEAEGAYGTPVIDGKIEAEWDKTNPIIMENCITYDDTEYIGWFKVLWDESNLYVLSRISSDFLYKESFQWEDDQIKIHIDEDNSRNSVFTGEGDYQIVCNWEGILSGWYYDLKKVEVAIGDESVTGFKNGYVVEMKIPFEQVKPTDGHKIALEMLYVTSIKLGMYKQEYLWNGKKNWVWNSPAGYGTITLKKKVDVVPFEEPESTGMKVRGTYNYPEKPLNVEKITGVNVIFDGTSNVCDIVHVREYPSIEINDLGRIIGAEVNGNVLKKNDVTMTFTAGERLAGYKHERHGDGHMMLEQEVVMHEGKMYVPVTFTEPTLLYYTHYNRFDKTLEISSGTNYPETELVFYARDFGAVGDGVNDDGPAIRKALHAAINSGKPARVELDANKTYRIGHRHDSYNYFFFQNVKNLEWDGKGSTLLFDTPTNSFVGISRCTNLKIKNLNVDYKEYTNTQGRIIEVDYENNSFLIDIEEGFPLPADDEWVNAIQTGANGLGSTGGWWAGYLYDKELPHIKRSKFDNYSVNHVYHVKDRIYRVHVSNSRGEVPFIEVGDRFGINTRSSAYDICADLMDGMISMYFIHYSGDITMENVNIYQSLHLGADVGMCWGRINFINCGTITSDGRLTATNSDQYHMWRNRAGITWDGCTFMASWDDQINTKGQTAFINSQIDDYTYRVSRDLNYKVGDELIFWDTYSNNELGRGFIKDFTTFNDNDAQITLDRKIEGVKLSSHGTKTRTSIWSNDACAKGSVVKGCEFINGRRFCWINRSPNTIIENSTFTNCGAGIQAANEIFDGGSEAPFPSSMTIRNTETKSDGMGNGLYPIDVQSWRSLNGCTPAIDGILIENNVIDAPVTRSINIKSVQDLYMINNTIKSDAKLPWYTMPIAITNSQIRLIDGVTLDYASDVQGVVNIAASEYDPANIKNIKVNEGNKTPAIFTK